jgi:hypothetical protein
VIGHGSCASRHGSTVAEQVVAIVERLVNELSGGGTARRPALDDALDRDLGISSRERRLRLQRAVHVLRQQPLDVVR